MGMLKRSPCLAAHVDDLFAVTLRVVALCGLAAGCAGQALANANVYRCAGKTAFFTNDGDIARSRACRLVGAPALTAPSVVNTARPRLPELRRPAVALQRPPVNAVAYQISANEQQRRDRDRRQILQDELKQERSKLQSLNEAVSVARVQNASDQLTPLLQASQRSQGNLEAISREIARSGN
jgi:hypothetical protein